MFLFTFSGGEESNNLSNSTLRRKLFEGFLDEDDDRGKLSEEEDECTETEDLKENVNPSVPNVNITPGAILRTPSTKSVGPTPDRSVSVFRSISSLLIMDLVFRYANMIWHSNNSCS